MRGFDFDGRHLERHGLSPAGTLINAPLHLHRVSLDFTRVELNLEYALQDNWDIRFRLPYDIKDQTSNVEILETASPYQLKAIMSNQYIHHRDETYRGLADLSMLLAHSVSGILRDNDFLDTLVGIGIPTGKTEADPYKAARAGQKHLHIQFGTGTFDPLVELHYNTLISSDVSMGTSIMGRFPFYENKRNYRGPLELTYSARLGYNIVDRLSLDISYQGFFQSYAYWDGVGDVNSGLLANSGIVGATTNIGQGSALYLGVILPFSQKTLGEGDTFERGVNVYSKISRSF